MDTEQPTVPTANGRIQPLGQIDILDGAPLLPTETYTVMAFIRVQTTTGQISTPQVVWHVKLQERPQCCFLSMEWFKKIL